MIGLDGRDRVRALPVGTSALLVILGVGLLRLFGAFATTHHIAGATAMAVALVLGGLIAAILAWRQRAAASTLALAGALVVANYFFVLVALPAVEEFKPTVPMVRTIQARTPPGQPPPVVAHYGTSLPSFVYYLDRPVEVHYGLAALVDRARAVPEMYVLMSPFEYGDLERAVKAYALPVCVVERRTLFEAKLKFVLEGNPWPEALLVGTGAACLRTPAS